MKCSKCGKEAKHFFSQTVNGKSSVLFLCDGCLFAGGTVSFGHSVKPAKANNNISCIKCGTRLNEFLESGYLGCADCYSAFAGEISKILPQIQVGTRHSGNSTKPAALPSAEQKLSGLKAEMDRAAAELRFDDAQKIYREIKKLEGGAR